MIKIFPFLFFVLWSSAFITTKPIVDNSDPFAALAFRFALVALGFFYFLFIQNKKFQLIRKIFLILFLAVSCFMVFILVVSFIQFQ